ncbi:hypothetical protein GCK32_019382, partial [Trichostrongylus colubriformis]
FGPIDYDVTINGELCCVSYCQIQKDALSKRLHTMLSVVGEPRLMGPARGGDRLTSIVLKGICRVGESGHVERWRQRPVTTMLSESPVMGLRSYHHGRFGEWGSRSYSFPQRSARPYTNPAER